MQQRVHAREGKEHDEDRDHQIPGHLSALLFAAQAQMEIDRVNDPRDQRPDLLGVPGPEGGPGLLGPDRAGEDHDREEEEAEADETVAQEVHLLERLLVVTLFLREKQIARADAPGDDEGSIRQHGRADVHAEPRAAQRGHQIADLHRLERGIGHNQQRHGDRRDLEPVGLHPGTDGDRKERHAPGKAVCKFKLVRQRQTLRRDAARHDKHRVQRKGREKRDPGRAQQLFFSKGRAGEFQDHGNGVSRKGDKEQGFHSLLSFLS